MSRTATGGGRYDPDEPYIYFLAGQTLYDNEVLRHSLMATNDVFNENSERMRELRARLDNPAHELLFDSGIFWLANEHAVAHGLTHDQGLAMAPADLDGFDKLLATYKTVVRELEDRLWGYIELDLGGADEKRKTRAGLEADGYRPIPVYHPLLDGWDYFDELAESYDRICVGNLVKADRTVRLRIMHTVWERRRRFGKHGPWLHLLGVTPSRTMLAYQFNSSDSSAYVYSVRYGEQMLSTRALFGSYTHLGNAWVYDRGHYHDEQIGFPGQTRVLTYLASAETKTMRHYWRDLRHQFGVDTPYPAVLPDEPTPRPALAA